MIACSLFNNEDDPHHLFNKQWLANETLELIGILILDISLVDMSEIFILIAEVVGFLLLAAAAALDFEFSLISFYPRSITLRMDLIHVSDCVGLGMLIIVSFVQYSFNVLRKASNC